MLDKILGIGNSIIDPLMQWRTNVTNRQFTREMYKTQRQDALSDWEMQNAYNSPKAQMARFKEAGLNPHLIYGQSNVAQPVRSSSPSGGQASAPRANLGYMYNFALKDAQADQTQQNITLLKARERQIAAQTAKTLSEVDLTNQTVKRGSIKLAIEEALKDVNIAKAGWEADLTHEKYNEQYWKSFFAEQLQKKNLERIDEVIKSQQAFQALSKDRQAEIMQRIELMKKDGTLKDIEKQYQEFGKGAWQPVINLLKIIFGR